jgi:DNA invertase Pin-like site-specific DNA recombinase
MIGYARVSSAMQKLDIQIDALTGASVQPEHLYEEKVSGSSKRKGRDALKDMLARSIRKGDTVVVTCLDRLARSSCDLHNNAHKLD